MTTTVRTVDTARTADPGTRTRPGRTLFAALVGLASVAILLQALWAGIFVQEGKDYNATWVEVHARGGEVAIVLAALATVVGFVKLRTQRALWLGSGALTVLLLLEAWLGGEIGDAPHLTAVHFPLGMALMALAVWLPLRARRA